jgi:hypothetical protein
MKLKGIVSRYSVLNILILIAIVAVVIGAGFRPSTLFASKQVTSISQLGPDWSFYASTGVPNRPSTLTSGSGWQFLMPSYTSTTPCYNSNKCYRVGYVYTPYTNPLPAGHSITMTVNIVSSNPSPTWGYQTESGNTCTTPANVRLFIEEAGDQKFASQPYYRWWSNPTTVYLQPGTQSITVPIDPSLWSSVFGEFGNGSAAATAGFQQAINNVGNVGMTFGGGCFFGHGVYETDTGSSYFQLISYTVN